jgi:predicted PurR-regulated permease PerM
MQTISSEKHFLYALLIIVTVLTFAIFWPFLTTVVLAVAFAVVLTPVYRWINRHLTKNISWLASLITILLFLIVLCIPVFFVGKVVFNQIQGTYNNIVASGNTSSFVQTIDTSINKFIPDGFTFDTYGKITQLVSTLTNNIAGLFTSTFNTVMLFILMLLTIFYLLKDGAEWKRNLIVLCPISEKNTHEIIITMKEAINRIFKGSFLIAIIQGILMAVGLIIFGVPNAAIWGVVAGMASFIPTLGTSIVSVPAILFLFFSGMELQALGMLLWAVIMVGTIDNILSPYFISKDTKISSLFILFSILGGVSLMGPVGIFIGPLVLSLLYSLVSIYKKEINI